MHCREVLGQVRSALETLVFVLHLFYLDSDVNLGLTLGLVFSKKKKIPISYDVLFQER